MPKLVGLSVRRQENKLTMYYYAFFFFLKQPEKFQGLGSRKWAVVGASGCVFVLQVEKWAVCVLWAELIFLT